MSRKAGFDAMSKAVNALQSFPTTGVGGRMSQSGLSITIFGCTGFLGRYVANECGKVGCLTYLPNRGCEMETRHLKPMFDHGNAGFCFYHPKDDQSIMEAMENSDIVINLIGKQYETRHVVYTKRADGKSSNVNFSFEDVHVNIPKKIAECAKEVGVQRFIHVSALAADVNSPSDWARTKGLGEIAVREIYPSATIVRPSIMFGPEDRFLNFFANWCQKSPIPYCPLPNGGNTLVQPVYVADVARAIFKVCSHPELDGYDLNLVGKEEYTLREIAEFVFEITSRGQTVVPVPDHLLERMGDVFGLFPSPFLTRDIVKLAATGHWAHNPTHAFATSSPVQAAAAAGKASVAGKGSIGFDNLRMEPLPMEKKAFSYLHRFRLGGHFVRTAGYH